MSSEAKTTGRTRPPRKPIGGWEILSLLLFGYATLMMTVDYVAIETSPLRYLTGHSLWYVQSLPLIGAAFVLVAWLVLRLPVAARPERAGSDRAARVGPVRAAPIPTLDRHCGPMAQS